MLLLLPALLVQGEEEYEMAPIFYSKTEPRDAVQAMEKLMLAGKVKIDRRNAWTALRQVLKHLEIPMESQVMVFSKTSKQNDRITPQTPRVVYFSDNAYVGYALGGSIEVSAIDPKLGPVFYLLDTEVPEEKPLRFERDQSCLNCHGGPFTPEVPGLLVRSVFPGPEGHPIMSQGSTVVNTTTPFSDRWGGWYVTGKHGDLLHRGNVTATENPDNTCDMPIEKGANVTDLTHFFDTSPYPRKKSDIVALMVLEHQTSVQNVLTKANQTAMRAMLMQTSLQKELGEPVQHEPVGTARRIIDHMAEDVVEALLFKDEAALPEGGIEGEDDFQTAFAAKALRSKEGRSLKDFQLLNRLFKHRCSFMIHSLTFQHLEPHLKKTVLGMLGNILAGKDASGLYDYLGEVERGNILAILRDTGVM
ncbi:hypothetical protein [Brevifollis gellanilyticus]|uniref:Cytochrome c domain-containing protein n=1 Tax=Brevifollis gellanilyticus TaxID=748831 RepID=A0A512MF38_9BACT|nr:hypothetical protein [Brevifollis gellanilyticus]GEP45328.1 hypothetical protein BGE01nite_46190 [Brevifollis gellanilyticus]